MILCTRKATSKILSFTSSNKHSEPRGNFFNSLFYLIVYYAEAKGVLISSKPDVHANNVLYYQVRVKRRSLLPFSHSATIQTASPEQLTALPLRHLTYLTTQNPRSPSALEGHNPAARAQPNQRLCWSLKVTLQHPLETNRPPRAQDLLLLLP